MFSLLCLGHCCDAGSIPGLGSFISRGHGQTKITTSFSMGLVMNISKGVFFTISIIPKKWEFILIYKVFILRTKRNFFFSIELRLWNMHRTKLIKSFSCIFHLSLCYCYFCGLFLFCVIYVLCIHIYSFVPIIVYTSLQLTKKSFKSSSFLAYA